MTWAARGCLQAEGGCRRGGFAVSRLQASEAWAACKEKGSPPVAQSQSAACETV